MGNKVPSAVCLMYDAKTQETIGSVTFKQTINGVRVKGLLKMKNVKDGSHGFHIHQWGDMSKGCESMGPHFDDGSHAHGNLNERNSHLGDFGNVVAKNNEFQFDFVSTKISLNPQHKNAIFGRGLVLHEDKDDMGRGANNESLLNGNSGHRIACGIIAMAAP
jgi:superoxide dismutase, Cu-Zn family